MCMAAVGLKSAKIIANKKGKKDFKLIDLDFILDSNIQNPDGFGYYAGNEKTESYEINKFYCTSEEEISKKIESINKNGRNYKFVITHSRFATSGYKGTSQMHPIPICHLDINGNNLYKGGFIIHNGVLEDSTKEISDTQIAGHKLGQGMYERNVKSINDLRENKFFKFLEHEYSGSRVIVVYKDDFVIFNKNTGYTRKYGNGTSGRLYKQLPGSYGYQDLSYGTDEHYGDAEWEWDYVENCYKPKSKKNRDHVKTPTVEEVCGIPDYDPKHKASC